MGLKFRFKFKLMIPEIGIHALAEGSRLTVPAPRRVQIFCRSGSANTQMRMKINSLSHFDSCDPTLLIEVVNIHSHTHVSPHYSGADAIINTGTHQ